MKGGCKCNNNLSIECGEYVYAPCVVVENDLPTFSEFSDSNCTYLYDIVPEIYSELEAVRLSGVDLSCLTLDGDLTHQKLEEAQNAEICSIKDQLAALSDCDFLDCEISSTTLDVSCLESLDDCGAPIPITKVSDLLQTLINRVCALESA